MTWTKPKIEHLVPTRWGWTVSYPDKLHLCEGVDIGCFTYIMARENVYIGHDVQIGSHCSIYSVSTIDNKQGSVVIGAGARIGSHSLIMPNVIIGPGLTVPAYSFIKRSILDKDELFEVTGHRMKAVDLNQ